VALGQQNHLCKKNKNQRNNTPALALAFTRYGFTLQLLCGSQSSFDCPLPPALPALLQCCCTSIAQRYDAPPTPLLYAIHYTIWVIAISCKGQRWRRPRQGCCPPWRWASRTICQKKKTAPALFLGSALCRRGVIV